MSKLPRKKSATDFSPRVKSNIYLRLEGIDENRIALKSTIEEIKKRYNFNENYNLLDHLDKNIATGKQYFEDMKRLNPRPTDVIIHLQEITHTAQQINIFVPKLIKLIESLGSVRNDIKKIEDVNYQKRVDHHVQYLDQAIAQANDNIAAVESELKEEKDTNKISEIRGSISIYKNQIKDYEQHKLETSTNKNTESILTIIEERLLPFTEDSHAIKYNKIFTNHYLRELINLSNQLIGNLDQKSDKGPQKGSSKEFLIGQLLLIFRLGTGKRPTCGTNPYSDIENYTGEFYEFLKDINELLIKSNLGTSFALSKFSSGDVKDLKRLIDSDFTKIREINPQKDDYKRISFTMTEILAIKKKLGEIIEDVSKTLSAKLVSGVYLGEDSTIARYAKKLITSNRKQLDEWEKNEQEGEDYVMLFPKTTG